MLVGFFGFLYWCFSSLYVELYIPASSLIPISPPLVWIMELCIFIMRSLVFSTVSWEILFLGLFQYGEWHFGQFCGGIPFFLPFQWW